MMKSRRVLTRARLLRQSRGASADPRQSRGFTLVVRPLLITLGLCSVTAAEHGSCRNILLLRTRRQTNKTSHLLLPLSLTVVSLYGRHVPILTKVAGHTCAASGVGVSPSAQTDTNEIAYKQKRGTQDRRQRGRLMLLLIANNVARVRLQLVVYSAVLRLLRKLVRQASHVVTGSPPPGGR